MRNFCTRRTTVALLSLLWAFVLLAGCTPPGPGGGYAPVQSVESAEKKGRLSLFLNLQETEGPDLSMQITAVDLLGQNGAWQNFFAGTVNVRSSQIERGQQFLARMALPPDSYTRIRLVLGEAKAEHDGGGQESLASKVAGGGSGSARPTAYCRG